MDKKNYELYPEISCPMCRIGFGGYKVGVEVKHLDVMWSYESGLILDCLNPELVRSNILSIDDRENPVFTEEFNQKLADLKEKYQDKPDGFTKENTGFDEWVIVIQYCLNYCDVLQDGEKINPETTYADLEDLYNEGLSAYDAIKKLINPQSKTKQS